MAEPRVITEQAAALYIEIVGKQFIKGKVLDVGCGTKPFKRIFPECEWTGLDIRSVGEIEADAHQIPCEDDTFDTVLCTGLLHLCPSPLLVVQQMARVLKPGGFLVVTAPNTFHDEDALFAIKPRGLDYLFGASGLKGVDLRADGRVFSQEWGDLVQYDKYRFAIPSQTDGWCDLMDKRYPSVTCGVATKE